MAKNLASRQFPADVVHRQRTALVSLSLVLLTYALAGGTVLSEVTLSNLPIRFTRPAVLLVMAWVIWAYFLYRYLLVTNAPWKAFGEEIRLRALSDPHVQAMCLPALPRLDVPGTVRAEIHRQLNDGWTLSIVKVGGTYHFDPRQYFRPATQAGPSGAAEQAGLYQLTNSEAWIYRKALLRAVFKAIALESTFSEFVLPHLLVWMTPIVWVAVYRRDIAQLVGNLTWRQTGTP